MNAGTYKNTEIIRNSLQIHLVCFSFDDYDDRLHVISKMTGKF